MKKALYIVIFVLLISAFCTHEPDLTDFPEICFTSEILPVFQNSCSMTGCHEGSGESGYILNSYSGIMAGISPGNPSGSKLYEAITTAGGEKKMPPDQPLSKENRTKIMIWITQGAAATACSGENGGDPGNSNYVARACFSRDILPVIVSHCASTACHDAISHEGGYNLTTYNNIKNFVIPGNRNSSKLYKVITTSDGEDKMPPSGSPQLTVAQIDSIGKWITYKALNENCGEVCDTVNPVTFKGVISPFLQLTCTGCHTGTTPSGNVNLANYTLVASAASDGLLMKSLTGNGVPRMPPSGPLSACRIRQFQIWISNGHSNN